MCPNIVKMPETSKTIEVRSNVPHMSGVGGHGGHGSHPAALPDVEQWNNRNNRKCPITNIHKDFTPTPRPRLLAQLQQVMLVMVTAAIGSVTEDGNNDDDNDNV